MSEAEKVAAQHRWSGWPGAWCLDCGADDPYEIALADDRIDFDHATGDPVITAELRAELASAMVCSEPGSKRHDPYVLASQGLVIVPVEATHEMVTAALHGRDGTIPAAVAKSIYSAMIAAAKENQ